MPDKNFYKDKFAGMSKGKSSKAIRSVTPETYGMQVERYYPSFSLRLNDIPEARSWDVGKTYKIGAEVVMKSLRMEKRGDQRNDRVEFELRKVKSLS